LSYIATRFWVYIYDFVIHINELYDMLSQNPAKMKQILLIAITVLTFQISFGQNADELNQQSKELVQQGKYIEAFPILKKSAELGNAEAQYNLGYFLQNGIGGVEDEKKL